MYKVEIKIGNWDFLDNEIVTIETSDFEKAQIIQEFIEMQQDYGWAVDYQPIEYIDEDDEDYVYDEDADAWYWYDEESDVWYVYDEDADDWVEFEEDEEAEEAEEDEEASDEV